MEKAYDPKALLKMAEDRGLPIVKEGAEEAAKALLGAVREWFAQSAALSANPIDNMIVPGVNYACDVAESFLEKINPEG